MKVEKLYPVCKDYLWGGHRLIDEYGKNPDCNPCAESWEISAHKDGMTCLANKVPMATALTKKDAGNHLADFPFFPFLCKLIDAKDNLSVQVHPDDDYALKNENSYGKTELWYIVDAEDGAGIYLGLSETVTKEAFQKAIAEQKLTDLLNFYPVKKGETYFIPSGTIHAIGKGCLIYEIQQNSNLTYRVYDYGRKGADGQERELHVEKAIRVANLQAFQSKSLSVDTTEGTFIGAGKYFSAYHLSVNGTFLYPSDDKTLRGITCLDGKGTIGKQPIQKGESVIIPANIKTKINGRMELIMTSVRKYYIGIDLGGTFIKGGIADDLGNLIASDKVPTECEKGDTGVAVNIANLCKSLLAKCNMTKNDVVGIGIGVPGMIDSEKGEVVYAPNLHWRHFMISDKVSELTGLPVKIANDANVAALGETKFGCGKKYKTTVMLTLGTGVGGGIVLDGKLYEGNRSAGAEIGHIGIVAGGEKCNCGRRGCLEAYASATALIRDTKRAMVKHPESEMWKIATLDTVDGATAFRCYDTDATAKKVCNRYMKMLAYGMTNIANELRPEAMILGGGICAEGERLTKPLRRMVHKNLFGGKDGPEPKILTAELKNQAGILGAVALWLD